MLYCPVPPAVVLLPRFVAEPTFGFHCDDQVAPPPLAFVAVPAAPPVVPHARAIETPPLVTVLLPPLDPALPSVLSAVLAAPPPPPAPTPTPRSVVDNSPTA